MAFWSTFDIDAFGKALQKSMEREIGEGIGELAKHFPKGDRSQLALERLRRKAQESAVESVGILVMMYREGVFREPPELIRRPLSGKDDNSKVSQDLIAAYARQAELTAELDSLEQRHRSFLALTESMKKNQAKLGEIGKHPRLDKVPELSRGAKRLRYLVQCTQELREHLPQPQLDLEVEIKNERQGMPSIRELRALDSALSGAHSS